MSQTTVRTIMRVVREAANKRSPNLVKKGKYDRGVQEAYRLYNKLIIYNEGRQER